MSTAVAGTPKKKHIKHPDDLLDAKDWVTFKRQVFIYTSEYPADFASDEASIRFILSFFKGGLPQKFAANFIDSVVDGATTVTTPATVTTPEITTTVFHWGTATAFRTQCDEAFTTTSRKIEAENNLATLRQGNRTAEEFFQDFEQEALTAGYKDSHHDDVLTKYI